MSTTAPLRLWVLGSGISENALIGRLLHQVGETVIWATKSGQPESNSGDAWYADNPAAYGIPAGCPCITVNCCISSLTPAMSITAYRGDTRRVSFPSSAQSVHHVLTMLAQFGRLPDEWRLPDTSPDIPTHQVTPGSVSLLAVGTDSSIPEYLYIARSAALTTLGPLSAAYLVPHEYLYACAAEYDPLAAAAGLLPGVHSATFCAMREVASRSVGPADSLNAVPRL